MTTIINGSSPSVTFSDGTTQTTAGLPLTGGTVTGTVTITGALTATGGVIQGANAAPCFSAYGSSGQTISSGAFTKVNCNTEEFDTNNNYDNATNYRFTPTVAGYYQVNGQILGQGTSTCTSILVGIYKNGSVFKWGNWVYPGSSTAGRVNVSALIYMNGSTDYLELYGYVVGTGTISFAGVGATDDYFQAAFVRSA